MAKRAQLHEAERTAINAELKSVCDQLARPRSVPGGRRMG